MMLAQLPRKQYYPNMPRRPLIETEQFPYHVTSRSNNKEWFYLPLKECWEIFCNQLVETSSKYNVNIYAFTLMSNHFHLILSTPQANLGEVMRHFLTGVSKAIQFKAKRINHIFGSRYKWSLLQNENANSKSSTSLFSLNTSRIGLKFRREIGRAHV